jgi:antitoxin (DNA-binding transcriptional repressor) of toxin-antitoxin stability system
MRAQQSGQSCDTFGPENLKLHKCDATMNHMKKASVRDLRYSFKKIERLLHEGEEIQITKRRRVIARLIPESVRGVTQMPDFLARLRSIYGEKSLQVSGAELIAQDRSRY